MLISFKDIPDMSTKLFLDYLYDFSKTEKFYPGNYNNTGQWNSLLTKVSSKDPAHRKTLAATLLEQNTRFGNSEKALRNIRLLENANSVAVVTGQQMGLFGGPLYTIYKALGTVKLCETYQKQFPEFQFVPVFWMELEDHDLEEIRSLQLFNIENDIQFISYNGADAENKKKSPINTITLNEDIRRVLQEVKTTLNTTDFSAQWITPLESAYHPDKSLSDAFGQWMASLLGKYGLVLMDPSDAAFKKLAAPVFKKELENADTLHGLLLEQSSALKAAGYDVQVENEPTNLFIRDTGHSKHVLNKNGYNKFKIKAEDVGSHRDELIQLTGSDPGRFIPNVILRPIVQDHLLPTFAYVGGPSEIAYFGQFKKIYEFFGIPEPLIVPRPFITVLEKKIKKAADKYSLTIEHIFNKRGGVVDEAASTGSGRAVAGDIELVSVNFRQEFDRIEKNLIAVDTSLKGAAETAWDKIDKAMKVLKDKTADAEKRKNELTHSQLGKAVRHIFPNDQFQEREINALYYLNKYGPGFIDTIYEKMDVSGSGHQVIEL